MAVALMQPSRRAKAKLWLAERVIAESAGRTSRQTRNRGGAPLRSGGAAAPPVQPEIRNRLHSREILDGAKKGEGEKTQSSAEARGQRALFGKARLISVWSTFPLVYI